MDHTRIISYSRCTGSYYFVASAPSVIFSNLYYFCVFRSSMRCTCVHFFFEFPVWTTTVTKKSRVKNLILRSWNADSFCKMREYCNKDFLTVYLSYWKRFEKFCKWDWKRGYFWIFYETVNLLIFRFIKYTGNYRAAIYCGSSLSTIVQVLKSIKQI